MKKAENTKYQIDATGQSLGRVASRAAALLRGKDNPAFERHLPAHTEVTVLNAAKIKLSSKKPIQKIYRTYTGYPGGLKAEKLQTLIARRGWAEPIRLAVRGMLPNNRLRRGCLKNLIIKD